MTNPTSGRLIFVIATPGKLAKESGLYCLKFSVRCIGVGFRPSKLASSYLASARADC